MVVAEPVLLTRTLDDGGLIEFEERATGYRAYHYTPGPSAPVNGRARLRLPSVTTILDTVTSSFGLLGFYEDEACAATLTLERGGFLSHVTPENAAEAVRNAGMGGKATAQRAAGRGTRIHKVLQDYAETGAVPNPKDFEPEERGYLRGLIRWILRADPQPVAVERLVAHPELRYAGRMDLRAKVYGAEYVIDLKTNKRAQIYRKAMLQAAGYHIADIRCGASAAKGELIVAVGPDGEFAEGFNPPEAHAAWRKALDYAGTYDGLEVKGVPE